MTPAYERFKPNDPPAERAGDGDSLDDVLARRVSRRGFLGGLLAAAPASLGARSPAGEVRRIDVPSRNALPFNAIQPNNLDTVVVPDGYTWQLLLRWGDPIHRGGPEFNAADQSPEKQAVQFGFNCDYVGFIPFAKGGGAPPVAPAPASQMTRDRGLLFVNHEYTDPPMMFADYDLTAPGRRHANIELAAHGATVIEVRRRPGLSWEVDLDSGYNRRITATTPMELTGPAAGHAWMRTSEDPSGRTVAGMLYNCGGGRTPWGTILTCEENFHVYFGNRERLPKNDSRTEVHRRYGIRGSASDYRWEDHHPRFDVTKELNEPFRFGWVVEVDPFDPDCIPKKRTALGRFRHEAATTALTPDGRVIVYSGDDQRFEYVYRFVSSGRVNHDDRRANRDLLDSGTLYVARFDEDGRGAWLPLVHGQGPLTAANGFADQGDVLLKTRIAADLLGATKMDRPEDIEFNPVNGRVYVVLTNNTRRTVEQVDAANPRPANKHGHIIELIEDDGGAGTGFRWELAVLCGDPADAGSSAYYCGFDTAKITPASGPDNVAIDRRGNLWIATDGMARLGCNDGLLVMPVEGIERGRLRLFASVPPGAECAGPEFTPDGESLFLAVQHPGEGSDSDNRLSDWPDGDGAVPRPSVVSIVRSGGGSIGS